MLTDNILDLIGNTPLIRLQGDKIYAKAEFLNPGGSIKDRVAVAMLEGARRDGRLRPDSIIVEPTSGNTGIGVALVGRMKGYRVRIVMPEGMSIERKKLIKATGAELVLTPDEDNIAGAVAVAKKMAADDPRVFVPDATTSTPDRNSGIRSAARLIVSLPAWEAAALCRAWAAFLRSITRALSWWQLSRRTSLPCWGTNRGCIRFRELATASSRPSWTYPS